MALKFRRGTTAQQSGSLAFGEPYVNTTLGTLVIGGVSGDIVLGTSGTGSTGTFGDISGSGLDISGNARIGGNLTLGGAITIGDATADTINVVASISSSLIPNNDNTFDIGSSSKIYRNLYGGTISGSVLEIMSGSNPELRLINKTTGIQYHIQNGDAGNFTIHNASAQHLAFRFLSASFADGNPNAEFFGTLYVSKSINSPTITGLNTFTGSADTRLTNLENKTSSLATTGSNTLKGNQIIIGSGTGFAAYISTSVNDGTLGLDTTANVNAAYFLKNGEKNFELSYDTTNANGIFRLLPYDNSSYFEIGNPSNSANNNSDYVFISEATYGNILMGPGLGNATSYLVGATPATDKVQIAGNLYVSGAIKANSFTGSIAATNGVVSGSSQLTSSYDNRYVTLNGDQTINGTKTFNDIVINGTGSFAYIQSVSGSAKIIGDSFIILNTETPTSRYAGLSVYDSGSTLSTASFYFDGQTNDWGYEYSTSAGIDYAVTIFGPEYTTKGTPTYLTTNKVPKAVDNHHLNDSNITDSGTLITLGSNTIVTGTLVASGTSLVSSSAQITGIGNAQLTNSSITIAGTSTALGAAITAEQIRTAIGTVVTGSAQIDVASTTGDITLGSRTSGNYVASLVAGTNITLSNNSGEGATPTIGLTNNAITIAGTSTSLGGTITAATILQGTGVVSGSSQISLGSASGNIALASQTTGDYVASLVAGTGVTLSNNSGENATPTIAIGQSVATNATPTFGNLTINGTITATGDITAYYTSDKRHKNNIQPITNALLKVSKLNGVTWEWNDDVNEVTKSTPKTGLIAQEVQEVLPEVVVERENGYLGLDYSKMMGLMVEAIKEQQAQIHNLTLEIENLKKVKGL